MQLTLALILNLTKFVLKDVLYYVRRTVGRLCSTAPRKCKNRYHEKPLYMTQIILKDYIIMNIGDFKPLVSYFMPIIGPKVTKVGPKSSLKRPIYV